MLCGALNSPGAEPLWAVDSVSNMGEDLGQVARSLRATARPRYILVMPPREGAISEAIPGAVYWKALRISQRLKSFCRNWRRKSERPGDDYPTSMRYSGQRTLQN